MSSKIVSRILRKIGAPRLLESLSNDIGGADLTSLMLEIYKRRASKLSARTIMNQYRSDRFVSPATVSLTDSLEFDSIACDLLPNDFATVELSPVCPLGTSSVLAPVDQNNIVTTVRNTEVCSDATNVLALEAATRRQKLADASSSQTKLCTSLRHLRAQTFDGPASFAHFRILALCTAGRTGGSFSRESEALIEHVGYYLSLLKTLDKHSYKTSGIRFELLPLTRDALRVSETTIAPLLSDSGVSVEIDRTLEPENSYYVNMRFKGFATDDTGTEHNLIDGGFTTWTQALLNNRKEYFLTSGMGTERMVYCFKKSVTKTGESLI